MIQVEKLSKRYGPVRAVDRVSFEVGRGEIVGLLGPNGAGKTTTMRMLTTYLPPTSGRAMLAGHDVLDDPLGVRARIGYLPENVPLYTEMRVREYVTYRAKLKDVPRARRRSAVDEVLARCQLEEVEDRILGHLSKGFRQRVGLAESMVHDPDILILDEPTAGLDPIQIREVRDLIRELGDRHTILLSTHIMQEVEAVCGRVLIIAKGRLVEDQPLEQLRSESTILLEARGPSQAMAQALRGVDGVSRVTVSEEDGEHATLEILTRDGADLREALGLRVMQAGWPLRKLDLRRVTLEERFVQAVTRASLSEAEPVVSEAV